MGAGRKKAAYHPEPPTQGRTITQWCGDQSAFARNLGEDELAGVIFGCTNQTINECLSKQLFGLPAGHFSYVKNIKPGLPLFLFNYSDRKLHGVFEAATSGQLSIDQFAWSHDGRTKTQYPAQVGVFTKTQCLPLPENKYKSVISGNYHKLRHFHFELDHGQTRDLLSLFVPAPVHFVPNKWSISEPPAPVPNKWSPFKPLPSPTTRAQFVPGEMTTESDLKDVYQFGVSSHPLGMVPHKLPDQDAYYACASRTSNSNPDEEATDGDDLDEGAFDEGMESVNDDHPHINPVHDQQSDITTVLQKLQGLYLLQQENAQSSKAVVDSTSDKSTPQESQLGTTFPKDPSNATLEGDAPVKDDTSFKQRCGNDELLQMFNELLKHTKAMGKKQCGISHLGYAFTCQIESDQEILLLKKSVKNVEKNVQKLQYQYEKLQLEYSAALLGETRNNLEGPSIFLIGGHNGITLLSSLDSFNPTTDRLEPLRPMSSARSYAAVAALKEHVFVFGGGDGITSWYNTVECYNRGSNEWVTCPRLKRKKGSLAGATLDDKIFAIGGGDGSQSFSEVEMFDLARGCWIYSRSMQQCRFTPGAAELNGILYVVGGYDYNSNTYLESAERYDPREGFWTKLASMRAKRGCHSLAVLGEDLYALGGHNGDSMVSTVEIFDPRANLWRINSPFSIPRGYGCAVTANDNLYLIGGIDTCGENVGTVEVYNMRQGWWIPGYKAIGMRSFASAIAV